MSENANTPEELARDVIENRRAPLDWYIEICAVCGCQLGPGVGSRTRTGRCIYESHRSTGGIVLRVSARPDDEQDSRAQRYLPGIRKRTSA